MKRIFKNLVAIAIILLAGFQLSAQDTTCVAQIDYSQNSQNPLEVNLFVYGSLDTSTVVYWNFGDGDTSVTGTYTTHIYDSFGSYNVTATINAGCGQIIATKTVIFDTVTNPVECEAYYWYFVDSVNLNTVYFSNESTIDGTVNYLWDFGDGASSTDKNTLHTYSEDGQFLVTLTVDNGSCSSVYEDYVWVGDGNNWYPEECQALFYPVYDSTGYGVNFVDISYADSPIAAWMWNFGDGNVSSQQNPSHVYSATGEYTVTLTIFSSDSCVNTFEVLVYIEESSVNGDCQAYFYPTFDGTLTVKFYDLSMPTPNSWDWNFGDGSTSNLQSPEHSFADTGVYNVTLYANAEDSCVSAFAMDIHLYQISKGGNYAGEIIKAYAIQQSTTAIEDIENNSINLSLYPNPVVNTLNVDFAEIKHNTIIQIYNTNGQIVYMNKVENTKKVKINTQDFSKGLYIMKVIDNGKVNSVKFIK